MKFKVMFNFLLQQMYCDRRGNRQKPTRTKPPGQKPLRTTEIEFVQRTFVRDFCTRPTKNRGGGPMFVVMCGVIFVRCCFCAIFLVRDTKTWGGGSEMCDVLSGGSRDV